MRISWQEISDRAIKFSKRWKDACNEKSEAQHFLIEFFNVFGVDTKRVSLFEYKVPKRDGKNGYIDLIWPGKIAIEMKSRGKSLDDAYKQLLSYMEEIDDYDLPILLMVCDFEYIKLYNLKTRQNWRKFKVANLSDHIKKFSDIAGYNIEKIEYEKHDLNIKAAEKMAKLHDELKGNGYTGHDLEVYLVRLLFCLFAEDSRLFNKYQFYEFISNSKEDGSDLSLKLALLFQVLNEENRQSYNEEKLKAFRYVNGGLFKENLKIASFSSRMRAELLECCKFDWKNISPAIFGAMFQGIMNPNERRSLGAHYTSEENILKVIKPLFLDDLWQEFERIKYSYEELIRFHKKIASLKFLDPACGCGNFLIIIYRELRKLEFEIIKMSEENIFQQVVDVSLLCKVSIKQFYGIEYEEFPAQIARVSIWLMEQQMNLIFSDLMGQVVDNLPLKNSATIINENALTYDWNSLVSKENLSYIAGNPPFVGTVYMNKEQRKDMDFVFKDIKTRGQMDYVCAWYKKAAEYILNTNTKVAFVSTNSITQGEQVSTLWGSLLSDHGIHIDFAYRTFVWTNKAKNNAAVYCVIIGFSNQKSKGKKTIFYDGKKDLATNINPYLLDASNIIINSRRTPICDIPNMRRGNQATDGGNLIIEDDELQEFLDKEPNAKKYIKRFVGSKEFINQQKRWCLWLVDCTPNEIRKMPLVKKRVSAVKQMRENSKDAGTRRLAKSPRLFRETENPDTFIVIPRVSSQKRQYIPIGFLTKDFIASDAVHIIPNASIYHFGILTSSVHMVWMRVICGRLKGDYRYSKDIVYNNFPWPDISEKQKEKISKLAQEILDIRELNLDSTLADLYDPESMPDNLSRAHCKLDREVDKAYKKGRFRNDNERIQFLFNMYEELTNTETNSRGILATSEFV